MTTLPEPLNAKMEENADKLAFVGDSVPPEECYRRGWNDLFQFLLESGMEFDWNREESEKFWDKNLNLSCWDLYWESLRWQHKILTAIYEAKLAQKDAEIESWKRLAMGDESEQK